MITTCTVRPSCGYVLSSVISSSQTEYLFQLPYYIFAIYAFINGCEWIRQWTIVYGVQCLMSLVIWMPEEYWGQYKVCLMLTTSYDTDTSSRPAYCCVCPVDHHANRDDYQSLGHQQANVCKWQGCCEAKDKVVTL